MNENFITTQGASISFSGTLKDSSGNGVLNKYVGAETLTTSIWPGGPRPASFLAPTAWIIPADGTFLVAISAAQTAALYTGVYEGVTRLTEAGANPDAWYFTLTVAHGPGGIPSAPTSTAITRLVVEVELIDRDAALLLLCGKSVMADGANRFLTGSLGFALQALGVIPALPGVVSDDDLARVPASQFYILCDLAEYRLLKNLLSSFAQPDQTTGNTKIHLNTMKETFRQQMLDLEKQYASYLGQYRSVLSSGSIRVRQPSSGGEL